MKNRILLILALALSACAERGQPQVLSPIVPLDEDGNLVLVLSNQSGHVSPIDLEIRIDGRLYASAEIPSGPHRQHRASWRLDPGKHDVQVSVSSIPGVAALRSVTVEPGKVSYLAVDFHFFFPDKSDQPIDWPSLEITTYDEPPPIL